jgi:lipopolysaccharide heptosyltransferase II
MKKILLINPFGIGDVLFTTPIIRALKENFPECQIGYLCNKRSQAIVKNNPCVDKVFIYDRDEFEAVRKNSFWQWLKVSLVFLNSIKKEHYDSAIDFSLNTQYGFFSWISGIKERIGYDYKGRGKFLTKKISLSGYNSKHIVEYYCDLLKLAGLKAGSQSLELFAQEADLINIESRLQANGVNAQDLLIGIVPGGGKSWGKEAYLKHWEVEKFSSLADKIIANCKAKIIIIGDFSEKEIAHKLAAGMKYKAINFSGATNIAESVALLSRLKLVVLNDGGPLHMAKALKIKTVSIFGPVDENIYGPHPRDASDIVIKKDFTCRPCYKNFRFTGCDFNRRCLRDITVEEVFEAVKRLLE